MMAIPLHPQGMVDVNCMRLRCRLALVMCVAAIAPQARSDYELPAKPRMVESRSATPVLDFEGTRLELNRTPMPFADWALVDAGEVEWVGLDATPLPLNGPHGLKSLGEVRVELCDRKFRPLPGHSALECDPIVGDHVAIAVAWRGDSKLPNLDGSSELIRFHMRSAKIYALSAE